MSLSYHEYQAIVRAEGSAGLRARYPDHSWFFDDVGVVPPFHPSRLWRNCHDGRVRVGFWCPVLNFGGAESWQLSLAKALDQTRIEIVGMVVTEGGGSAKPEMIEQFEALMPIGFGTAAARDLAQHCDVIVQWAISGVDSILAGLASRPKVIAVSHSPIESTWAISIYQNHAGIDSFVAVHDLAIPPIPEPFRDSAKVIWNAVTESRLTPTRSRAEMRTAWGVPIGAYVVGYIGRIEPDKNPACLATAIDHLPDDTHVVVVGDGWDYGIVKTCDHPRFHYVGPDVDAGSVLSAFDTLIVPSLYESFGLSLAEGLWCGVPVISTPVGIAKPEPWLTRSIPFWPSGEVLAEAVAADRLDVAGTAERVTKAKVWAADRCGSERFGREWSDLIVSHRPPSTSARLALISSCPDRGSVLPHTLQPECGCAELTECRAGKGSKPGTVTLAECLACKT